MIKKLTIIGITYILLLSIILSTSPVISNTCSSANEVEDLDIDSDNDDGTNPPERTEEEDVIEEDPPGKYVMVNDDDDNGNDIPDKDDSSPTSNEDDLIPLILEIGTIPGRQNVSYKLEYPTTYIRIWRSSQRGTIGSDDEVINNEWYDHETWILGDMNGDGELDGFDNQPWNLALNDPDNYNLQYGFDPDVIGDMNGDGVFDESDTDVFVDDMVNLCFRHVPLNLWIEGLNKSSEAITISSQVDFDNDRVADENDVVAITVLDKPQLVISAPNLVTEGESFNVTITANTNPITNVKVVFDDIDYLTDKNGIVSLKAPMAQQDTEYIIIANKEGYTYATKTITIKDRQLMITTESTVIEGNQFSVYVKREDTEEVVESAEVTFNEEINQTNTNGQVYFIAPEVGRDTDYTIIATKEGYQPDTTLIKVLNQKEQTGWIYGVTLDASTSSPLEDVRIEVLGEQKSWSTYSNEKGEYLLSVLAGTYDVVTRKDGYKSSTKNDVTVNKQSAVETNFMLEKSTEGGEEPTGLVGYVIQNQIKEGKISAEITIEEPHVTFYSDAVDINLTEVKPLKEGGVSLTISGEENFTFFVVYLPEISDNEKLVVTYDGQEINETTNLGLFFNNGNPGAEYIRPQLNILFIRAPLSEHTISISSIVEALGGPIAVLLYIVIGTAAFIVFAVPVLTNFIRFRRSFQKKK